MTCLWNGANAPRVIKGRHDEDCTDREACRGCQPCTLDHCRVDGRTHVEGVQACPECVGETRDDLGAIGTLCGALRAEARHKGVESEAMALLAPAADPEAWGHMTTSLHVGRLPSGYLRCDRCDNPYPCEKHADGEVHPLFVLGTWDMVWRDALDHETDEELTVESAIGYLGRQLAYMAGFEDAPFEDFARDLRRCRAHLERVLHDGEQRDTGAPCMSCKRPLTRRWGKSLDEDGWECKPCRETSNQQQYTLAVKNDYIERAEWLTDADMVTRASRCEPPLEVKAGTIRAWASDGYIRKRRHSERTEYAVADVLSRLGADTAA